MDILQFWREAGKSSPYPFDCQVLSELLNNYMIILSKLLI